MNSTDYGKYYSEIIDHMPGAMIVFGIENGMLRVRYISDNCEKISGFTAEETYKRSSDSPVEDVHPDDREMFAPEKWKKSQKNLSFTYRIICKDGRYKWVHLDLSKAEDSAEELYFGMFTDVDEEHSKLVLQKENDLKTAHANAELQHMYDSILDETRAMITVIDAETYKVVYANKTAILMANKQDGYLGCVCYKDIHNADAPCEGCLLQKPEGSVPETEEVTYAGRTYRMLKKIFMWNGKKALLEYSEDITDRTRYIQAEKKLADDKIKGGLLLSAISGGVALYHIMKDGTIRSSYISEGLAGVVGYTSDEFLEKYGQNTKECVYPEDLPIIAAAVRKILETGTPISNHFRLIKKDGSLITVNFNGNIIDSGSKLPGEVATLYAVQTLASDESVREYEENEERRRIFENIPGGIGLYDLFEGKAYLDYLNDSYLNMMGLERKAREKLYGKDITAVVHSEDKPAVIAMINRIESGSLKDSVTFRVQTGNGAWKWIHLELSAVKKSNGHYIGYGLLYDFDEIIRSQQEMEMARKKEETLISSIPGGIAIYRLKKNGSVATEYVSENLAAMCDYTADEFLEYIKKNSLINLVPEDVPIVNNAVAKTLEDGKPISVMYRIYKKDKSQILIRLDANIIESEQLAEDDVAVFYAVHTLVSDESKRIIAEQKTFSQLLNAVPAGIGIFTIENGVLNQEYMNDAFYEILGIDGDKRAWHTEKKAIEKIHPDDIKGIRDAISRLENGASAAQADYRRINGSGKWTWIHAAASVTERKHNYIKAYSAFYDCTESKEQQLLLLRNERAVALAQNQGNISIWTYNIDKDIIMQQTTPDALGHMGYPVLLENVPRCFIDSDSIYPDDVELFLDAYRQLRDGADKTEATYRLRSQITGEFTWVHMYYQRMENNSESDRIAVGFSMNVDKQQEAIERYHTEQSLREQLNAGVLMYIEYNLTKDCCESIGKHPETYKGTEWNGISPADYMKKLISAVEDAYANEVAGTLYSQNLLKAFTEGETKVSVEYRSKERPGQPSTWHRTSASLVKRPDTGDIMAFIYIDNIEEEKERKLAMESSMSDGIEYIAVIHIADKMARLIKYNETATSDEFKDTFLYNEEFVKRSHCAVIGDENGFGYREALLSTILGELENKDIYQYSVTTVHKNSTSKRRLFRYRYMDDRKTNIILSVSDITEIYEEEQKKNKELENALSETNKAGKAKADFYSRMSHDMRTPMNGILGMTALSEEETDIDVLRENMRKIHESGEYLLNLINDTLDVQRIESGRMTLEPQIVNTVDMVENILDMIRGSARSKGVNLRFNPGNADLDWYVLVDPLRMKQIFINLLSNAVKFTPAGGTVDFEFKLLRRDGMISHDVVYIRDTGLGMSEEFLKNGVFKPFSQENNAVSAKYAGSGLGLSIAKSLVELMGGHIEVESKLGVGTTFSVYIDFERVSSAEAQEAAGKQKIQKKAMSASLRGKRILLCEDHPLNAEIAKKLLQRVGCEITWVQDGREAVSCFENTAVNYFDLILMDIRMPVMDGLEATKNIRALNKTDAAVIPIVAMTANAYEDDIRAALDSGMNAHVAKPVDPAVLYETIAGFLVKNPK